MKGSDSPDLTGGLLFVIHIIKIIEMTWTPYDQIADSFHLQFKYEVVYPVTNATEFHRPILKGTK